MTERFGGVQAVSVDVNTVETHLDQALEQAHDGLQHRPAPEEPELGDELCSVCLQRTHGGRVNPKIYSPDIPDDELSFQGSPTWLEEHGGWVRIRPTLLDTLAVIERQVNDRIPSFVAEHGQVRLGIRPVTQWDASSSRCQIMFNVDPGHADPEPANWDGPIGILGHTYGLKGGILQIPLADLGAGMRRWVATVVRQAADAFATGEISAVRWVGPGANMDQSISASIRRPNSGVGL